MTALRRIVIVGNGIAGVTAADTLRAAGYDGDLTLVGDEPHPAYSRPALSKALLRSDPDDTAHLLPPPGHGAVELTGVRATGLDVDGRQVQLDDGRRLDFDGLVIATGCRPRRLRDATGDGQEPIELVLRTIEDAMLLRERMAQHPSVVVVGGGPLGMEVASACREIGCPVTLVSHGPPLLHQLGAHLSSVFVAAALDHGLVVRQGRAVSVDGDTESALVRLADGSELEAHVVVTAIGDVPNDEWLASSGLLREGRLVVDEAGRVRPDIVACGDVAVVRTPRGEQRVPLWSAAIDQSRVAAASLIGEHVEPADARPYFWTEQFGLSLKAVGHLPFAGEPTLVDGDPREGRQLLHWAAATIDDRAAASINYRIPIPKLRRLGVPAA